MEVLSVERICSMARKAAMANQKEERRKEGRKEARERRKRREGEEGAIAFA